jgi:hydrogenase small subunit
MSSPLLGEFLRSRGVTRRDFLQFCTTTTALMGLSSAMVPRVAAALEQARRPSVIWLPFQECTGCTESITRAHGSTLESLIFQGISLDYQHTLQAAAGDAAERARETAMKENWGRYLLIVDGSIPTGNKGFSTIAGHDNLSLLQEAARGARGLVGSARRQAADGMSGV